MLRSTGRGLSGSRRGPIGRVHLHHARHPVYTVVSDGSPEFAKTVQFSRLLCSYNYRISPRYLTEGPSLQICAGRVVKMCRE